MVETEHRRAFLLPALGLLSLALLAQVACWAQVVSTDRTPLVDDSGELYRLGLVHHFGLPIGEGRPLPPLLGRGLGLWLGLTGPGRLATALAALLVYLLLVAIAWRLASRLDGPVAGFLAAVCCASLPAAIGPARYLIPDQPAALVIGGLLLALLASQEGARWWPMLRGGALTGLALLCKVSLAAYLIPISAWLGWLLVRRRPSWPRVLAALAASLAVSLPWYLTSGREAARFYLADPATASSATWGMQRASADYLLYYPRILWSEMLGPALGGLLLLGLLLGLRRPAVRWLTLYALAVLALFTAGPFRVPRYLFGLLPLLAALGGVGLARLASTHARALLLGGAIALYGAGWSIGLLLGADWHPNVRLHRPGLLHAEDLAGFGLLVPIEQDWGGQALADACPRGLPILVVGPRPFALWDFRLALLERGVDPQLEVPRMWPEGRLSDVLPGIGLVLYSDYSILERDYQRRNIFPVTPAELRRRGYRIEAEAERWFLRGRRRFRPLLRQPTPDGKQVSLFMR